MAGGFNGSTQYLIGGSAPVSAVPLTMACWFIGNSTLTGALMSLGTNGGTARYSLVAAGTAGGDPIQAGTTNSGGTGANGTTSTGFTTGPWYHACGVFASTTSRSAYLNGAGKGTDTTSITASADRTLIGARINGGTVGAFYTGRVADAAIWNIDLTDAEVASLATGMSPLLIRPQSLVFYAPLYRNFVDYKGMSLTNTAGVTVVDSNRHYGP
jgi:hypothetical protein